MNPRERIKETEWTLTALSFGRTLRFACLGRAGYAEVPTIAPVGHEVKGIRSAADLAQVLGDVLLLKPVQGVVWREPGEVLFHTRKWPLKWIERSGGRLERFSLPLAAPSHGGTSCLDGFRIILPAHDLRPSFRKLCRVVRVLAGDGGAR